MSCDQKGTATGEMQAEVKPIALSVTFDGIPSELRERGQWLLWRLERREGDWSKVPYSIDGRRASVDDPSTWGSLNEALGEHVLADGRWAGVGYVFATDDPFLGIDLDACLEPDGRFLPWSAELRAKFACPGVPDAIEIVKRLATYCEVSPSASGVKIIGKGKLPGAHHRVGSKGIGAIEMYDRGRFFAITGHRVPGTPTTVNDCQAALDELYHAIFGKPDSSTDGKPKSRGRAPTDDEVWNAIRRAKNAEKIIALVEGKTDGYASPSEADSALACHFAFYSRDSEQIARLMRRSALARQKWGREDYLPRTIAKALETVTEFYDWNRANIPPLLIASGRTETANAQRLAARHGGHFRWCDPWGKWLVWDGRRWALDQQRVMDDFAKSVYRGLWDEIADFAKTAGDEGAKTIKEMVRFAKATGGAHGVEAMLKLCRSEPGIPILPDALDRDPWLLNCPNGTLDLRTGTLRPHRREDCLTKLCPVEFRPTADCPLWLAFLREITGGDESLQQFLRGAVGMSITGMVRDHVLMFLYGTGANGKSTFVVTIQELLGPDYAMKAPPDLLMAKRDAHPTERADLKGKRFVACVETGEGRRLAEALVKELTGGDRVRARRMREDFWEFSPTHKIWLAANHKPIIRGTDYGIWRRIKLIPFTVTIPTEKQDKDLAAKLKAELPGILNWALRGCIEWQAGGLGEPEAVRRATSSYRSDMDILGLFLDEDCVIGDNHEAAAGALYAKYKTWAERQGERRPMTQQSFGEALTERGFTRDRFTAGPLKGRYRWLGIGLHHQEEERQ